MAERHLMAPVDQVGSPAQGLEWFAGIRCPRSSTSHSWIKVFEASLLSNDFGQHPF